VPLTLESFKKPLGRLDRRVLWPRVSEVEVDTMIEAFITDAQARGGAVIDDGDPDLDTFIENWVYWRAFDDVHLRMLVNPSSYSLGGQGGASWLLTQIQDVERLALEARDAANAVLAVWLVDVVDEAPIARESACVKTTISFDQ
jgi:hypothetical protein